MTPEDFQKHRKEMINDPVGFAQEYLLPIKKKRGRPRMTEMFFYDPYERLIVVDSDGNLVGVSQRKGM